MTKPTFRGELQFVAYADSSRAGPRVTFRLSDRDELQRFVGLEGRRFAAILLEIGDDEQPVVPIGQMCRWAVMRCAEDDFQAWVALQSDADKTLKPADMAKQLILDRCRVQSRKDLDTNEKASGAMRRLVLKPYAEWMENR